ncbi:peritrophin-44-like [Argopecten irradians]|uniref:peritrophin-44-like n=1 Tax=Argopecten irradians TaxID=31199 RepID=UPI003723CB2F
MVVLLVLLSAIVYTGTAYQCSPHSNATVEIGCRSYYSCVDGHGSIVDCTLINSEYVYNSAVGHCDDPANVAPPCGQQKDCSNMPDRKFADVDNNCTSYYTCYRHSFYGHNNCSPGLVFDENLQSCNWPRNVPPPCGTKTAT